MNYIKTSHTKTYLMYHLVLVCKYRKKLFTNTEIDKCIKKLSVEYCIKNNVKVITFETDKDHLHMLFQTNMNINLSNFIRSLKAYTTYHVWLKFESTLNYYFWKEHTFWSDGIFISSVGNNEKTVIDYINNNKSN